MKENISDKNDLSEEILDILNLIKEMKSDLK